MTDLTTLARKVLVEALKAEPLVTALCPRVYGPEPPATPQWPWAKVDTPLAGPARANCLNGQTLSVTVHAFAKGPGDDAAALIGSRIADALDMRHFQLDDCAIDCLWQQTQVLRDSAEASAYHAIIRFAVEVAA